jgi:hypothetical protein
MDMENPQDVGVAFWTTVLGVSVSKEPPAPDTPLGRVRAFTAEHGEEALREEHVEAAVQERPLLP